MEIIRDKKNSKVLVIEDSKKLLEMSFIGDEFGMIFYQNKPLIIEKELDENFYDSFSDILDNSYMFTDKYSSQRKDEITWLSDSYGLENKNKRDDINRLIISKDDERIYFETLNPYFEQLGLEKNYNLIIFSPEGNGKISKNNETGTTFQNDIIYAFINILEKKKDKVKVR